MVGRLGPVAPRVPAIWTGRRSYSGDTTGSSRESGDDSGESHCAPSYLLQ